MKKIILFLLFSITVLGQTNDSLTVTWSDSPSADLDSIYLVYWKVNPVVDTTIFARLNEGIETWSGIAPDSGLLYIAAVGKDDSANYCFDSSSVYDTVTVLVQAGGGGSYPTDSLQMLHLYTSLENGDVAGNEWLDETDDIPYTAVLGDPNKDATGVVLDGNDAIYRPYNFSSDSMFSVVVVVKIIDTASSYAIVGWRNTDDDRGLTISYDSNHLNLFVWNPTFTPGTTIISCQNSTQIFNENAVIIATWTGSTAANEMKLYINGTEQSDEDNYGVEYDFGNIILGYGAGLYAPNGTTILASIFYTKVLTQDEVDDIQTYFQGLGFVE